MSVGDPTRTTKEMRLLAAMNLAFFGEDDAARLLLRAADEIDYLRDALEAQKRPSPARDRRAGGGNEMQAEDPVLTVSAGREQRQARAYAWVKDVFGEEVAQVPERVARLLEEVIELAQSEGIPQEQIGKLVNHVYAKPVGRPEQEVGGVGLTLLAYCEAKGLSAEQSEVDELTRVRASDPEQFRERHNRKADAGVAVRTC